LKKEPPEKFALAAADVDESGTVDIIDLLTLKEIILNEQPNTRVMKYAERLITPDITYAFKTHDEYSDLSSSEKVTFNDFFNVTDNEMTEAENKGLDLRSSVILILSAKKVNVSLDFVVDFSALLNNPNTFDNEIAALTTLLEYPFITEPNKEAILTLLLDEYSVIQVASAMVYAKSTNKTIEIAIAPHTQNPDAYYEWFIEDSTNDFLTDLIKRYHLNAEYVHDTLYVNDLLPEEFAEYLLEWQQANNFFIVDNGIMNSLPNALIT